MKKILLLIAALILVTASAMAQDVYLGVKSYTDDNITSYSIKKNGNVIFTQQEDNVSYELNDMIVVENGDVYYLNHMNMATTYSEYMNQWTDVCKISGNENTVILNSPANHGINLKALAYDNGDIYACGSYYLEDGHEYALITKNSGSFFQSEEDGYSCSMNDILIYNGDVFTCGEKSYLPNVGVGGVYATVWKNGEEIASYYHQDESLSFAHGLAIYDGYVYVCGRVMLREENGYEDSGIIWRADLNSTEAELEPFISIDETSTNRAIAIDAGSIYYSFDEYGGNSGLKKYNIQTGENEIYCTYILGSLDRGNFVVTNHGVYSAPGELCYYYIDGNRVYDNEHDHVNRIAVYSPREYHVYDLPFEDNFQNGETHYDDWFSYEFDEGNGGYYSSYWDRFEYELGEIAVSHRQGCSAQQQADLVTPPIRIPEGYSAKLGFYSKVWDVDELGRSEVWIFENPGELLTNENYAQIHQERIWQIEDDPYCLQEDDWNWVEVDIPEEYIGKTINLVFFYNGTCAHRWIIDDVEVTGTVKINENVAEELQLSIMPNPASDFISINGLDGTEDITIYNTLGQVVKTAQVSDGETISIEGLSQGVYMLQSEKSTQTVKFVVE